MTLPGPRDPIELPASCPARSDAHVFGAVPAPLTPGNERYFCFRSGNMCSAK